MEENKRKIPIMMRYASFHKRSTRLALMTIIYGVWLYLNQNVLSRYLIYDLLKDMISTEVIAAVFITIGVGALIGVVTNIKAVRFLFSTLLTVVWTTWAISFFITPPPNSVWLFSVFISLLSYEALWVDKL